MNTAAGEVEPAVSRAGLTVAGWSKLDAALRTRTLSASAAATTVAIFVESKAPEATRTAIEAAGGKVGTVAGNVMTARIASDGIASIANSASVTRLESATPMRRKLDKALAAVKADQVHAGASPLPGPFTGAGVVVGVVDNGIDAVHAAFKKPNGKTRVHAIWNQSGNGTPPAGFTYGSECKAAQIDDGSCTHPSIESHGTHVTGIAAGGTVSGAPYVGVAPEADIVFVESGGAPAGVPDAEISDVTLCDAASYIFKLAADLKKPAVVNMSLGAHDGPHDGSSLGDRCLDNLSAPGKIIVAAAGNEGEGSLNALQDTPVVVHASATASSSPIELKFLPGRTKPDQNQQSYAQEFIHFWSDANVDLSVRIGFQPRNGGAPVFFAPVTVTRQLPETKLPDGTGELGPVAGAGSVSAAGPRNIRFILTDGNKLREEEAVTWLLEVTGNGRFDAFIDTTMSGGFIATGQAPGVTVDSYMTIGSPASAAKVLAVGSFVSRNSWTASDGKQQEQKGRDDQLVSIGALSAFSSHGPMRNPTAAMKPDIAAPGEILISALNPNAKGEDPNRVVKAGSDGFLAAQGTSMASPLAAGVVALLLQRDPKLTVDDVRGILDRTAVKPEGATNLPSTTWGRGKLDALAALSDPGLQPPEKKDSDGGCNVEPAGSAFSGIVAMALGVSALLMRRRRARS